MSRKHNAKKSDDNSADVLLSQCFKIDANVKLRDIPSTGEEYLLKVITERNRCRSVTKCNKDLSVYMSNQSCFADGPPATKTAPEHLKPTIEWQNLQIAEFSNVRMYVSRMHSKRSTWPSTVEKFNIDHGDTRGWLNLFQSRTPTLSLLFGMSQNKLEEALEFLVFQLINKIAPGQTIERETGHWIYSILACLKLPLLPDTCSLIRDLARKCAEIRCSIQVTDENAELAAAPLNLFVCLVARYFRQVDLAD